MIGALAPSGGSDSAQIQAALSSGRDVLLSPGTYYAANLTQSTARQRLIGLGDVRIIKNANGPIITSTGSAVEFSGIGFRGDAGTPTFTGDNVVSSGNDFRLINCGSRWAHGRAVKATGSHVQIHGTCDIYQTADVTGTGYDIEIGVSGTATYYHELHGIYSSQATGGLLFTDTGGQTVTGGQFGKYTIAAGTSPAGVNGGRVMGARILGDISIGLASAIVTGNAIGAVVTTFLVGTSGCQFLGNTLAVGATVVNNGNANNLILRETSAGSVTQLKFGADASTAVLELNPSTGALKLATAAANFELTDTGNLQWAAGQFIRKGAGVPEGALAAPVGSLFLRTDGGASTTLYVKTSGTGNTGWTAK